MAKILLLDDERNFVDGREHTVVRSTQEAIQLFTDSPDVEFDEMWLDFILAGNDTVLDFALFAKKQALAGSPLKVKKFIIHTSSGSGYQMLKSLLEEDGVYVTERFTLSAQTPQTRIIE